MKQLLYISAVILLSGCLRLDSNLFNNSALETYELDDYGGPYEIELDSTYDIADSLITVFTLESQLESESESTTIYAIYVGDIDRISSDTVIMYFHGTRDHMDFYWNRQKLLAHVNGKNRYGVLMIDYRGYGMSEGTPTEEGLYADGRAAFQWLKDNGLTGDRLMVYGFSLGTAPATELTSNGDILDPAKLMLEAPFASVEVMTNDGSALAMPASFLTNLKIDVAEDIKKVEQPFLWIHGTDDNFLDFETHGKVVYKNHQGEYKEAVEVEGGDHGDVPAIMGFDDYLKEVGEFVRR